jgi:hypothetical protein
VCAVVWQKNQVPASGGADKNRSCFQAEISQVLQKLFVMETERMKFLTDETHRSVQLILSIFVLDRIE